MSQQSTEKTYEEVVTKRLSLIAAPDPKLLRIGSVINGLSRLSPKLAGWIALQLFMRPRRRKTDSSCSAGLSVAEQLEARARHRLWGYRWGAEEGDRPRVLLVHGWESHSGRWLPLVDQLRAHGVCVTAFDGPAQGRSGGRRTPFNEYIDAAIAFEAAHGPFDAYVGHSLGGGVVAQLAARVPLPRRPGAVVVMAGFDESEHVFARYHKMLGYHERVQASYDRHIGRLLGPGAKVKDYSNTAAVAQLADVRGLVVHSELDEVTPVAEGLMIHAAWPGAELLHVDYGDHALTDPRIVTRVADWVIENAAPTSR